MTDHNGQLLDYYRKYRIDDQLNFYTRRKSLFDKATGQGLALAAMLLGLTSAVSALAGANVGWAKVWLAASVILPAVSTALAAYLALYAFDQQAKIYGDAVRAIHATARQQPNPGGPQGGRAPEDDIADFVGKIEGAFRQESAQWGQLVSQVQVKDETKG